MLEVISPNVSLILPLQIGIPRQVFDVKMHSRGIIEIDILDDDKVSAASILADVKAAFEAYDKAGHLYPVNVTGLPSTSVLEPEIGSVRFCGWEGAFAKSLTYILQLAEVPELYEDSITLWQFECVSKYFRFMRYSKGGQHYPHYDSDFVVTKAPGSLGAKTLYATKYSLVMYFNDCETGEIAFLNAEDKDQADWDHQATDDDIFLKIKPKAGKIVLFPHNVCHTVLPYTDDGERYIVRGDLIFTRVQ